MIALVLFVTVGTLGVQPLPAATVPSKTAPDQSLDARAADLARVQDFVIQEEVAAVLAEQGFSADEVNSRLAKLSDQDLSALASNLDQIQAAGISQREWMWILIGGLAVLIIVLAID
ncbi:MAG TPA: PA2779 family protein [Thermoanaerobaculia bacterium]|nr:PA2779 family protein [Thermoanaerobaculia bacterium]